LLEKEVQTGSNLRFLIWSPVLIFLFNFKLGNIQMRGTELLESQLHNLWMNGWMDYSARYSPSVLIMELFGESNPPCNLYSRLLPLHVNYKTFQLAIWTDIYCIFQLLSITNTITCTEHHFYEMGL